MQSLFDEAFLKHRFPTQQGWRQALITLDPGFFALFPAEGNILREFLANPSAIQAHLLTGTRSGW